MLGKYFGLRKNKKHIPQGLIDKHHQAMQLWMENNKLGWEYIEYTTLTTGYGDTYQKHISTYYCRRFQEERNDKGQPIKDGWISSFIINPTRVNEIIKKAVYEHSTIEGSLKNFL